MLVTTLNYFTESPRKLRHLQREASLYITTTKNIAAMIILWKHFVWSFWTSTREEFNHLYCLGLIIQVTCFAECIKRWK